MAKQIYIDENGNEHLVSGTINTASMLPVSAGSSTSTAEALDAKQSKATLRTDNFLVQDFQSDSITIGANGALNVTANTMNYQIPNGYTPIAIAGWYTGSNDTFARSIEITAQGAQSFCVLRNVGNTAFTGTFKTKVLFIKTGS